MLIRARGPGELGVRYTGADQVMAVDLDGKPIAPVREGYAAPLEVFIHTAIYKVRPDVHSVIHVHPPTIVLFTICDKPLLPLFGAYDPSAVRLALEGIPTFDRSVLINSPELGSELVETMGGAKTCLMRGHGITTAAPSVEQAALYVIWLNELAAMNYHAHLLGDPRPISRADQTRCSTAFAGIIDRRARRPAWICTLALLLHHDRVLSRSHARNEENTRGTTMSTRLLAAVLAAVSTICAAAAAQVYPSRRFVNRSLSAGGVTDGLARMLGEHMRLAETAHHRRERERRGRQHRHRPRCARRPTATPRSWATGPTS
jgi:ribulose-5-phosphate 4-epimerase/fuculose-1-phosphate aldolase